MEKFTSITDTDLVGHRISELSDTPQLTANELKKKFDELVEDVVVPAFNNLVSEANNIDEEISDESDNYVSNKAIKAYVDEAVASGCSGSKAEILAEAKEYTDEQIVSAKEYTDTSIEGKVDKVEGKELSTNDYTSAEKTKLASLKNVTVDTTLSSASLNPIANKAVKDEMDAMKANFQDGCDVIAGAITAKGVPTSSGSTPAQMASNIMLIEGGGGGGGGTDVSDTTATASTVLSGKVFYNKYGSRTIGTLEDRGALSVTPTETSQEFANGYYSSISVSAIETVEVDILASNVAQEITPPSGKYITKANVAATQYTKTVPTADKILTGNSVSFSVNGSNVASVSGTMANNGALVATPSDTEQIFPGGYYSSVKVNAQESSGGSGYDLVCAYQGSLPTHSSTWRQASDYATSFYNTELCSKVESGSFNVTKDGTLAVIYMATPYNSNTTSNYTSGARLYKNNTQVGNQLTGSGTGATAMEVIPVVAGDNIKLNSNGRGSVNMVAYFVPDGISLASIG